MLKGTDTIGKIHVGIEPIIVINGPAVLKEWYRVDL
jgi:hypothetical protein